MPKSQVPPQRMFVRCREPDDGSRIMVLNGYRCVGVLYAVIQVAVYAPFYDALTVIDAVLGALQQPHRLTRECLLEAAERWPVRTQALRAKSLIELGDGASESPRESRTRAMFLELGTPVPFIQHRFDYPDGTWSRLDFWWPELGIIAEYDGWSKLLEYGDKEAFRRERIRHERLMARPEVKAIIHLDDKDVVSLAALEKVLARYQVPMTPANGLRIPVPRMVSTLRKKGLAA